MAAKDAAALVAAAVRAACEVGTPRTIVAVAAAAVSAAAGTAAAAKPPTVLGAEARSCLRGSWQRRRTGPEAAGEPCCSQAGQDTETNKNKFGH